MKKIFILFVLLGLIVGNSTAQIKKDQQRQQQQKQYEQQRKASEMKEAARVKRGQITLLELQQLADKEDVSSVDKMLSAKGWAMYSTEIDEGVETVTFSFDKNDYDDRALYWAYWNRVEDNHDRIWMRFTFADVSLFGQIEKSLAGNGYVKQSSEVVTTGDGGIVTTYRNNRYEATLHKILKQTRDGDAAYIVTVQNYKREEEKKKQEEKARQSRLLAEQKRIKNASLSTSEMIQLIKTHNKNDIETILKSKGFTDKSVWQDINLPSDVKHKLDTLVYKDNFTQFTADFHRPDGWDVEFFELYLCGGEETPYLLFSNDTVEDNVLLISNGYGYLLYDILDDIKNIGFTLLSKDSIGESNGDYSKTYTEIYQKQDFRFVVDYEFDYIEGCVFHKLLLYNFSQAQARKAEYERKAKEKAEQIRLAKEKDDKFNDAIRRANYFYEKGELDSTKKTLEEALAIKPEKESELTMRIENVEKEILITSLESKADSFSIQKQYALAKQSYMKAMAITPNPRLEVIREKNSDIDSVITILEERLTKWYDYQSIHFADYNQKYDFLTNELKNNICDLKENIPQIKLDLQYSIDTLNKTSFIIKAPETEKKFLKSINDMAKKIQLIPCLKKNIPVNAQCEYTFDIAYKHSNIVVKKTPKGLISKHPDYNFFKSNIHSLLGNSAPYAKYSFDLKKMKINEFELNDNKIVKMKVYGGPANVLLSLLVPGLGDHRVSFGERKGIGITISTYALAGAGVGCLLYNRYKPENPYENYLNYTMYGCFAAAGAIWLSDIIWVAVKGAKNKKAAKEYERLHLSAFYEPTTNAAGVAYSLKF